VIHRHVHDDNDVTCAGIEDVIVRGDRFSQKRLFNRVAADPFGETASRLHRVVESGNDEIASYLAVWGAFLDRARKGTIHKAPVGSGRKW
jgi:hypothetical protein